MITNEAGSVATPTQEFTTYTSDSGVDACENAEVRRQTEGSLLPDCRAYELVSAADQGGYDVESELAAGQTQLEAYPDAKDRLLYSMHFGVIPGIAGSPTNNGLDPYVAVRGGEGWTTRYVGLPANGMADEGAFGSPLTGADEGLQSFAFGGSNICHPCFGDGSINVPLRRPDGTLEEGMRGSLNPPADPVGEVRKPLSADGSHLIFATDQKFVDAADSGTRWVYDRDLADQHDRAGLDDAGRRADHRRSRRARRLLRRRPGPGRPSGRRRRRRQHPLRPLHACRRQPELDRGRRKHRAESSTTG